VMRVIFMRVFGNLREKRQDLLQSPAAGFRR
jgi:hypothetical protein